MLGYAMFKHYLIVQAVSSSEGVMAGRMGESAVVDRFFNLAIGLFAALFVLDLLEVEMGTGLKSMFALGGAGTLVISLASKDLAEQFISGVFLHASDKFYEGDYVTLGDGTAGVVSKIGWMHTLIRCKFSRDRTSLGACLRLFGDTTRSRALSTN